MSDVIELSPEKRELADGIIADGWLVDEEVSHLKKEVFADGIVNTNEVDLFFYLDAHAKGESKAWGEFFVSSLTDFFVYSQYPPGLLTEEGEDDLIRRVSADGKINAKTEFQLLRNIIKVAKLVPDNVICLALQGVKETVLGGGGKLFGPDRQRKGVIDDTDVEVIRDIVYGLGGGGGFTVSQREAELLFELNDVTKDKKNAAGWQELFVKGVGNFLMFPRRQAILSEAEYVRREKWGADISKNKEDFIAGMGAALSSGKALSEAFDTVARRTGIGTTSAEKEYMAQLDQEAAVAEELAKVDEPAAEWLLARIDADGVLHENEVALLKFVKSNATLVPPALSSLFEAVGV